MRHSCEFHLNPSVIVPILSLNNSVEEKYAKRFMNKAVVAEICVTLLEFRLKVILCHINV